MFTPESLERFMKECKFTKGEKFLVYEAGQVSKSQAEMLAIRIANAKHKPKRRKG